MSGVNIFGAALNNNNKIPKSQRGPPGIGFKYLDSEGNFDIQNKRLANIQAPNASNDAVNKRFLENSLSKLRKSYQDDLIILNENIDSHQNDLITLNVNLIEINQKLAETASKEYIDNFMGEFNNIFDSKITNNLNKITKVQADLDKLVNDLSPHIIAITELRRELDILHNVSSDIPINVSDINILKTEVDNLKQRIDQLNDALVNGIDTVQ